MDGLFPVPTPFVHNTSLLPQSLPLHLSHQTQTCVSNTHPHTHALPPAPQEGGKPRFTSSELQQHLAPLLERLFAGFKLPDSGENEYLMRAVTRVVGFIGNGITPVAPAALQQLAAMLMEVCVGGGG